MTLTPSLHHVQQFPGLPFYVRWFAFSIIPFIKLKKRPNFTQLTSHDMPSGCGRKGIWAPQKDRTSFHMYWSLVLCQCHSDLNHAILYCVSNSTRHQWIISKHIQLARSSYYNCAPLPSLYPTGYTSWPTPTSPYDWSYPSMSIPHLPSEPSSQLPQNFSCHQPH